jgi:hypothetical protein
MVEHCDRWTFPKRTLASVPREAASAASARQEPHTLREIPNTAIHDVNQFLHDRAAACESL